MNSEALELSEFLLAGGNIKNLISPNDSLEVLSYVIKLESFRLILGSLDKPELSRYKTLPIKICIKEVGKHLNSRDLWIKVKPMIELRNELLHNIGDFRAIYQKMDILIELHNKLDVILKDCWDLVEKNKAPVNAIPNNIKTCKVFI